MGRHYASSHERMTHAMGIHGQRQQHRFPPTKDDNNNADAPSSAQAKHAHEHVRQGQSPFEEHSAIGLS